MGETAADVAEHHYDIWVKSANECSKCKVQCDALSAATSMSEANSAAKAAVNAANVSVKTAGWASK